MRRNAWLRRAGAVVTSAAVAATLTLLSPGAAQASVHASFGALANADADYSGPTLGGDCTLVSPVGSNTVVSSVANFKRGTRTRSADLDATFASTDNAADTVRVRAHVKSTLTVRKRHRDLRSFDMATGGSVTISHSMANSTCIGSGIAVGSAEIRFSEHRSGWLTLTRDTKKPHSLVEFLLLNRDTSESVAVDFHVGSKSHATARVRLKPGRYVLEAGIEGFEAGASIFTKSAQPRSTKVAKTIAVHAEFKPKK
jgi:hypothetical protein